ncbi:hypothetical protein T8K17_18385 [Thalassobaculum sp. OXR-137]|uniref:hypothetical protein n=1 Tax=Thalassobaculum sp. OXR-137 TaxID=3100173 RepID=UPI002AC9E672|nr:hypothetical protein [Thalassobaculum sp. OXR-137]WPZ33197.1 hypothetical protein T8K17_18385 [Thalassobaculum sp. OXR-137]
MAKAPRDPLTLDLLSWVPKEPLPFPALNAEPSPEPRGCRLTEFVSRQVADALRDTDLPRDEVARRMSGVLGEPVSAHMLNAYASQARDDHNISHARMIALAVALDRPDLLAPGVQRVGKVMIDRPYLSAVRSAMRRDEAREYQRMADMANQDADRADREWRGR